ncbi:MAG: methyl-accepting chemotaxis protein [Synechococcus sp.]
MQAFAREEYSEAAQLFEQLTNESPEDLSLKLWLASSQQWAGRLLAAKTTYESVLANSEDRDLINAAKNGLTQIESSQHESNPSSGNDSNNLPMESGVQSPLGDEDLFGELSFEPHPTDNASGAGNPLSGTSSGSGGHVSQPQGKSMEEDLESIFEMADSPESESSPSGDSNLLDDVLFGGFDENESFAEDNSTNRSSAMVEKNREETNFFTLNDQTEESGLSFAPLGDSMNEGSDSYPDTKVAGNETSKRMSTAQFAPGNDFTMLDELPEQSGSFEEGSSTHFAEAEDYEFEAEPFSEIPGFSSLDSDYDKGAAEEASSITELFDIVEPAASLSSDIEDDNDLEGNLLLLPEDDVDEVSNAVDSEAVYVDSKDAGISTYTPPTSEGIAATGGAISGVILQGAAILAASTLGYFGLKTIVPDANLRGAAGAMAGAMAGAGIGIVTSNRQTARIRRNIQALCADMATVAQGNYTVRATLSGEDATSLALSFNQMAQAVEENLGILERRAAEQGQAKEDLQRQVIRLLDDVEGAARGDLTVRAEVTADVLGAVADSFNLTIASLREIVGQVKQAATAVNDAANDNESLARDLSNEALRQADDISSLLNSVQGMTQSIQEVAGNAKEAEQVAQQASTTAIKGGEAVERTAAGILTIRETVAETTRQVKRLAESSQEISKIVAFISQIASRTNLLALNASIEAARAGEAGRGFAIVADEVRQLSDRSSKASKEIEQIVMQIQSETSQVMTAMEEGTQQVIEGTKLAEQAKSSLDEIIQVSQKIDGLVRSITAATVEQTETSRTVAQVMQNAELTSNETSQEAQKVSSSLMKLVAIARDLQSSVGKFRTVRE